MGMKVMVVSKCTSYKHQVIKESKSYPLLEHLHQTGITDAILDDGYRQIDYLKPGEWGRIEGAGDCYIDERELREFSLSSEQLEKIQNTVKGICRRQGKSAMG